MGLNASSLGGRVAEVGWKFTSLAGQKAAELSENVTEKVKEGSLLQDLSTGVAGYAGKVTDAVGKRNFDLSSLWGSTRSEYQPCEDSGQFHSSQASGGGGYQDLSSPSPTCEDGRGSLGGDGRAGGQDWGGGWGEGQGWGGEVDQGGEPERKPKKASTRASASDKKAAASKAKMEGELLIDFGGSGKPAAKGKDTWEDDWEKDAWESLNN